MQFNKYMYILTSQYTLSEAQSTVGNRRQILLAVDSSKQWANNYCNSSFKFDALCRLWPMCVLSTGRPLSCSSYSIGQMLALTSGVFLYYFSLYTNVLWEILGHDPKLCCIYVYIQCNKQDKYLQQCTKYYVSWVHVLAVGSLLDFSRSKHARSDF